MPGKPGTDGNTAAGEARRSRTTREPCSRYRLDELWLHRLARASGLEGVNPEGVPCRDCGWSAYTHRVAQKVPKVNAACRRRYGNGNRKRS